jgi:outer membrane immunogenic protein
MKKILIAFSALAMGTAAASAADLPVKAYTKAPPPVVAPIYNWSGFYIGLNGGGGSAHKCWAAIAVDGIAIPGGPQAEGCHNATGGTVGGQIGYRWQVTNWVFGVEAQGNWADFTGTNVNLAIPQLNDHTKMDAFGLFTGQVGWAWNNVLFYAKGGAAVVDDKYTTVFNTTVVGVAPAGALFTNGSETRWGGTAGVGVEFGFAPGWSVGVEYDHLWLGTDDRIHAIVLPAFPASTLTQRISQNVDIGLVRVNYTFGGPVVARY